MVPSLLPNPPMLRKMRLPQTQRRKAPPRQHPRRHQQLQGSSPATSAALLLRLKAKGKPTRRRMRRGKLKRRKFRRKALKALRQETLPITKLMMTKLPATQNQYQHHTWLLQIYQQNRTQTKHQRHYLKTSLTPRKCIKLRMTSLTKAQHPMTLHLILSLPPIQLFQTKITKILITPLIAPKLLDQMKAKTKTTKSCQNKMKVTNNHQLHRKTKRLILRWTNQKRMTKRMAPAKMESHLWRRLKNLRKRRTTPLLPHRTFILMDQTNPLLRRKKKKRTKNPTPRKRSHLLRLRRRLSCVLRTLRRRQETRFPWIDYRKRKAGGDGVIW
mmetsp:Transcript_20366/g.42754  ORF Transcript_20366/g.42754 Transcript_20366/m.42754 type:complete len:328 (+) Transcript_20366:587-1570(+)